MHNSIRSIIPGSIILFCQSFRIFGSDTRYFWNAGFLRKSIKVMRWFLEHGSRKMPVPLQPHCNCACEMSPCLGQMWNGCGVVKVRGRSLEECQCVHKCDYIHVCKKGMIFPALIFAKRAHADWHCILTSYAIFHLKQRINV